MNQLSLMFEPGLSERHGSLRECVAAKVYGQGVTKIAGKLDLSPSKLSEKMAGIDSGGNTRGMTLDEFEKYIADVGDVTPILYLAAKYCRDPKVVQAEALATVATMFPQIIAAMAAAGFQMPAPTKRKAA